tara:strand:+ start:662 stop:913 length:252 start_codon:yes stop_codon:yes gene_type:complete
MILQAGIFKPVKCDMADLRRNYNLWNESLAERHYTFKEFFRSLLLFYKQNSNVQSGDNTFSLPKNQNLYVHKLNELRAKNLIF